MILHILHTNDFHNALTDAGAARLREAIAELGGAPHLLLDAGDAVRAGNTGVSVFGEPILDRMSDTGYHAMTMGNREFHFLRGALHAKIRQARFPVLCANVRARKPGDDALPVQPFVSFEIGDIRVVVFGLTVPMITERMKVAAVSAFLFDDPVATAARLVPELRRDADVLIALTHIGLREDERLARSVPGIDLIIGGHSHNKLPEPQIVENTPIVQAGWHAHLYGHVAVDLAKNGPARVAGELHPLQEKRQ